MTVAVREKEYTIEEMRTLLLPSDQYRESDFTEAADALKSSFSNGMYTFCIHFGVYENKNADIPVTVMRDRADMALRTIGKNVNRIVAYFNGEIMESALVKEPERRHPVLSRLQEAGFLIEIDDFGKGQSSLSLLKDIRADILKLDMGFLRETENRKRGQIILRTVITMANKLGMQVIAEGIETEKQLRSLSSMGCNHFQGYYFSRPIPVADFENKYKKQRPSA